MYSTLYKDGFQIGALVFDWMKGAVAAGIFLASGNIFEIHISEKPRDIGQVYLVPENTPNSQVNI